ncbi:ELOB protein, partial [Ptilonorhynchus violaceus]|nr:ELOB protein [Ptilonorhynchus violaceus]
QDVFLMIRRHKTTIFTEAKESSTVLELKRIVQGILHRPPDEQRLYKVPLKPSGGALKGFGGDLSGGDFGVPGWDSDPSPRFFPEESFEGLRIEPFSSPPELPDVMKPQDSTGAATD